MMNDPRQISIKDYSYDLPSDRIAQYPLPERDASKLLIYKDGAIQEDIYRNFDAYLEPGSILFFNNTRVVQARLLFHNQHGGKIEVFCLEPPKGQDIAQGMASAGSVRWLCMVGGLSKWKSADPLTLSSNGVELQARLCERLSDAVLVEFTWSPSSLSFAELLDQIGVMPIPPYLKRSSEAIDQERYQTVYAREKGSVAAPTAGLHFTERIFESLAVKNIFPTYITLHVGAGTFKPVKAETMAGHEMHAEYIDVEKSVLQKIIAAEGKSMVAVGTTSLRTIESLYWLGVYVRRFPDTLPANLSLPQWAPYEMQEWECPVAESLTDLMAWMDRHGLDQLIATTGLLIAPGYQLRIINALATNFHQPESTLMLLVAALTGDDWKQIYAYALAHDFRFLSYGDGSLLFAQLLR